MTYKILLLATHLMLFLHCTIYVKTFVGMESWPPWTGVTTKWPSFLTLLKQSGQSLLPSHPVPELRVVCHSDVLLLFNLVFHSFQVILFQTLPTTLQSLSYCVPGKTNIEGLLTTGSCCTGSFLTCISVSFSSSFFK